MLKFLLLFAFNLKLNKLLKNKLVFISLLEKKLHESEQACIFNEDFFLFKDAKYEFIGVE
jgi:hypothetical protein